MDFSFIPTDNLYKFLALSGVFLFAFTIYLRVTKMGEVNNAYIEFEARAEKRLVYSDGFLEEGRELLSNYYNDTVQDRLLDEKIKLIDGHIQKLQGDPTPKKRKLYDQYKQDFDEYEILSQEVLSKKTRFGQRYKILKAKYDSSRLAEIELKRDSAKIDYQLNEMLELTEMLKYLSYVSLGMMILGFVKWYELQRELDRILYKRPRTPRRVTLPSRFQRK